MGPLSHGADKEYAGIDSDCIDVHHYRRPRFIALSHVSPLSFSGKTLIAAPPSIRQIAFGVHSAKIASWIGRQHDGDPRFRSPELPCRTIKESLGR